MERCPLLRRLERKPEAGALDVIEECDMKEDADEEKEEDGYMEAAEGRPATRKDKGENTEGRARTEAQEGDRDQVLRWNLTTCHAPGGAWLEQVHASIRAWSTYWVQIRDSAGILEEGKGKGEK
ncbi:hypothetical protein NDU88_008473 [Pleurodeles waltl]|uniref:Uncharacterized protein n=1 Tax=Pleurodeles waltl TaxID=8319 RepID=A0AAV7N545_PLEWA|nr:hypothetical protein NDU88_008473 [Pleurodeles waltl]